MLPAVAHVVDERPRAIERRGTEVRAVPADDVATRVADAAADALDRRIDREPLPSTRRDRREFVVSRRGRDELPLARAHLSKNSRMSVTRSRITGRFASGAISSCAVAGDRFDVRAARPARATVDGHRARAAHADAAGEPIGERRIDAPLDVRDDVEHGLRRVPRHVVGDEAAACCRAAAPDANRERAHAKPILTPCVKPPTRVGAADDDTAKEHLHPFAASTCRT